MAKKFSELTKDFSPERRARIEAKKAELRQKMDLDNLHKAPRADPIHTSHTPRRRAGRKVQDQVAT